MTPQTTTPKSMEERVLQEIQQHKLAMRSKLRVALPHILILAGAIIIALIFILHTSSLLYGLRLNGSWNLLKSDLGNTQYVLRAFPWLLAGIPLLLAIAFAVVLSRMTRAYRIPLLYTVIAIPLVIVGVSVLVESLPGHEQLQSFTTSSLPVVGTLDKNVAETEPAQTYIGEVHAATAKGFTLVNRKGTEIRVEMTPATKLAKPALVKDDQVVQVIGLEHQGKVVADAIQSVPAQFQQEVLQAIDEAEKEKGKGEMKKPTSVKIETKNANTRGT